MESLIAEIRLTTRDEDKLNDIIHRAFEGSLPEITSILHDSLGKNSHYMLTEHRFIDEEYYARRNRQWFEAFDLLEEFSVISYEIGEDIGKNGKEFNAVDTCYLYDILLRLHARSIQITKEILVLMRHGFADGAMARWRTMHEISVIALFISKNGNLTAKMYKEFCDVESYKEMISYSENSQRLGFAKLADKEILRHEENIAKLKKAYGDDFVKPYGWTMLILDPRSRTFKGIEASIDQDHLRPFYNWACNAVHAGPKAAYYRIGSLDNNKLILAGPTNYGFADPGQNTALSLFEITSAMILHFTTFDNLVAINLLSDYLEKLTHKFVEIQQKIEKEEFELTREGEKV